MKRLPSLTRAGDDHLLRTAVILGVAVLLGLGWGVRAGLDWAEELRRAATPSPAPTASASVPQQS